MTMYVGTNKFFCFYLYYFDHFTFIFIIFFLFYSHISSVYCLFYPSVHTESLNTYFFSFFKFKYAFECFFLFEQCIIQYSLICKYLEIYLLYFCYFRLSPLFSFFHCFQRTNIYGFFPWKFIWTYKWFKIFCLLLWICLLFLSSFLYICWIYISLKQL